MTYRRFILEVGTPGGDMLKWIPAGAFDTVEDAQEHVCSYLRREQHIRVLDCERGHILYLRPESGEIRRVR